MQPASHEVYLDNSRYQDTIYCSKPKRAWIDVTGYIPVVGTVTGALRILLGIVQLAASIFNLIVGEKEYAQNIAQKGGMNLGRGFIELIPIVSFAILFPYDHFYKYRSVEA